jgi:hypothetical protein
MPNEGASATIDFADGDVPILFTEPDDYYDVE